MSALGQPLIRPDGGVDALALQTFQRQVEQELVQSRFTAWRFPALNAGWGLYGGGYSPLRYRRSRDHLELRGLLVKGTAGQFAATLPHPFWPEYHEIEDLRYDSGSIDGRLNSDGGVQVVTGATLGWVSLQWFVPAKPI